ncbi:UDP-glucose 4-epimerase GalE [Yersinia ruckeri]|uniref:UDP-glucose 4-epimerase GalE n=1 Tax=Yersinia ruckeri TaxID=29486 RepID=UPI0020BFBF99|nr:UDP-glucose 4-epimerase GalE [Yersinia ruckeri]EKN4183379.1 UDP-glucose 4-epimerase GalE [Yersinia ruckeri]EKN4695410.1 UDP-glucose 4-epimerase GalE [Yersinia ruckeri]MCK8554947.1 UDP-glucose 4-epimerase GalE [Yersinia ruckeri]MCW6624122.1 UDP-glucose 4-epimerase GalE [Yersinia ruckeri]
MAILVTGGAGYIGSHTILALLSRGDEVIVLDNFINASLEALMRIKQICGHPVPLYRGDIRDRALLRQIFSEHYISDVIHFAGLKAVSESVEKPLEYYDNNVNGTLIMLEEMHHAGVQSLIFSSSATVYGNPESVPLNETSRTGGTTNPYGTSKLMVEQILQDVSHAIQEMRITTLRYFNPVGAHPSGLIGEDPHGIPNNLIPYIAQVAVGKLACLSVFGNDYPTHDGTGVRDYIHVMDLAAGHLAALDHRDDGANYKVYNLGTGVGYSVLDIIAAFEKCSGVEIPYCFAPRRAGDIAECWSDSTLATKELGWHAQYDLDQMMNDTWSWQQRNPNGYQ